MGKAKVDVSEADFAQGRKRIVGNLRVVHPNWTLQEIATKVGITRERARQILIEMKLATKHVGLTERQLKVEARSPKVWQKVQASLDYEKELSKYTFYAYWLEKLIPRLLQFQKEDKEDTAVGYILGFMDGWNSLISESFGRRWYEIRGELNKINMERINE